MFKGLTRKKSKDSKKDKNVAPKRVTLKVGTNKPLTENDKLNPSTSATADKKTDSAHKSIASRRAEFEKSDQIYDNQIYDNSIVDDDIYDNVQVTNNRKVSTLPAKLKINDWKPRDEPPSPLTLTLMEKKKLFEVPKVDIALPMKTPKAKGPVSQEAGPPKLKPRKSSIEKKSSRPVSDIVSGINKSENDKIGYSSHHISKPFAPGVYNQPKFNRLSIRGRNDLTSRNKRNEIKCSVVRTVPLVLKQRSIPSI